MDAEGRIAGWARIGFAAGAIGLGLVTLLYHSFLLQWQPVPDWVPQPFVWLSGGLLIIGGAALVLRKGMAWGGLLLGLFLAIWVLALKLPEAVAVLPKITKVTSMIGTWLGVAEDAGMTLGALTLYALAVKAGDNPAIAWLSGPKALYVFRLLYGVCCIEFGLSHFSFIDFTASMIPGWLPFHVFFAWLTGIGHVCAGIALITGILPRLGATLEGLMMSLFVLLVHIPLVVHHDKGAGHIDWVMVFIATTQASAAFAVAAALRDRPWGFKLPDKSGEKAVA